MESEIAVQAGAALHEKSPQPLARRNGYRERLWQTHAGEIELAIPRLRSGSYFPSFLEPRSRSEKALVAVVQEAYVNGVSRRKVERLVTQLGLSGDKLAGFQKCYDTQATLKFITGTNDAAGRAGITSTPTYMYSGKDITKVLTSDPTSIDPYLGN